MLICKRRKHQKLRRNSEEMLKMDKLHHQKQLEKATTTNPNSSIFTTFAITRSFNAVKDAQ